MNKFSLASIKESLRIINVISFGVYRAASKERLMYGFLILSVFFVLLSSVPFMMPEILQSPQVVLPFSPRTEAVIIGFTWVNIFLMLISIFISLNVLQDILSKDSIAMLLSKPIRRWQIIEGIFFGLFKICLLNWFVMSASLWLVIFYHGNEAYNHIWLGTSVSLLLIMLLREILE
jgi:ABC-type transport system involved in multi-copper enzyme maturation permease subunit